MSPGSRFESMDEDLNKAQHFQGLRIVPDDGQPQAVLHETNETESQSDSISDDVSEDAVTWQPGGNPPNRNTEQPTQSPNNRGSNSKRERVRSIGHRAKRKSKHVVDAAKARLGFVQPASGNSPCEELGNDAAFDPDHVLRKQRLTIGDTADKVLVGACAAGKAMLNPRSAMKKKAAAKLAVADRPYLTEQADNDYLDAHADLSRAHSSRGSDSIDEEGLQKAQDRVDDLENVRDGRKVAWTTSKHISRVMVVTRKDALPVKREDFQQLDKVNGSYRIDWKSYIVARIEYSLKSFALLHMGNIDPVSQIPFDKDIMIRFAERAIIASSPWQSWFLSLRKLYRWENPKETARWAFIWFFIWYMDFVVSFILLWVVFIVLENRFRSKQAINMRDSYDRALNKDTNAFRLNELISRHGLGDWVDPLIDEAGPMLQMQLSDLADFLEVLNNFYDWRSPQKTWATLFWFACAIATAALTGSANSMKIIWMCCYLSFFIGRPIASRYPQYRHNVNAVKWIYWDIPTDAEWSMKYLRRKAQDTRARLIGDRVEKIYVENPMSPLAAGWVGSMDIQQGTHTGPVRSQDTELDSDSASDTDGASWHTADSSTSILGGLDMLSFRCRLKGVQGRLIIFSDGLRFVRSSPFFSQRKEQWRQSWMDLVELRKINVNTLKKVISTEGLHIMFTDGSEVKLESVKGRDRAFNCIIGFSGLQFQTVQPEAVTKKGKQKVSNQVADKDEGHEMAGSH